MTLLRHLPNAICLARIMLIWPILDAVNDERYAVALIFFAVAAVSDGLDGFLAKRFAWTSELGRFLDPLADKLLLVSVFLVLTWAGWLPWWLTTLAIARDVMIAVGALVFRFWFGALRGQPTLYSKLNTALQISVLVAALLQAMGVALPWQLFDALVWVTAAATVISGADYLHRYFGRAWQATATGLN